MGKREKIKEFHRSTILEIAGKLFVDKGFAQTTMDDIAKEADYSKSTIYVYFKSKDEIYSHIILENMALLRNTIEQAIEKNTNIEDTFFAICNAHVNFQEENPLFFESMIHSNFEKNPDEQVYHQMLKLNNEINEIICDLLNSGIGKQKVKPNIDTKQTAFALWSSICGLVLISYNKQSYIKYLNVSRQDFLNYSFRTLLNSILI